MTTMRSTPYARSKSQYFRQSIIDPAVSDLPNTQGGGGTTIDASVSNTTLPPIPIGYPVFGENPEFPIPPGVVTDANEASARPIDFAAITRSFFPSPTLASLPTPSEQQPDANRYTNTPLDLSWQVHRDFYYLTSRLEDDPAGLVFDTLNGLAKGADALVNQALYTATMVAPFLGEQPLGSPVIGNAIEGWWNRTTNAPNLFEASKNFAPFLEMFAGPVGPEAAAAAASARYAAVQGGRWLLREAGPVVGERVESWMADNQLLLRIAPEGPVVGSTAGAVDRSVAFDVAQLQAKYKHAVDFGVEGNWSLSAAAEYEAALRAHIDNPATQVIQGSYRREPATHFVNAETGLNVVRDAQGSFWTAWKLSPIQIKNVTTTGKLGGG